MSVSPSSSFNDNFAVIGTVGRGSFGEVIKVRRREDSQILVCKVLSYGNMSEKEKQLIVSEVNILRELRHDNIVRYEDRIIDKRAAKIYILMEYCVGGDLGHHIKRKIKEQTFFAENRIWRALSQLILAFEECHYHKEGSRLKPILHRDIKPCNILLDSTGNIKVGDFGLATELAGENNFAYTNVGTPYYMSPELIKQVRYNEKSDIWALGCLVYEMANLHPPFKAANVVLLGSKITKGEFPPLHRRYSKDLRTVVKAMLTVDPSKRPSIRDLRTCKPLRRYFDIVSSSDSSSSVTSPTNTSLEVRLRELDSREDELNKREKMIRAKEKELELREAQVSLRERRISMSSGTPPRAPSGIRKSISPSDGVSKRAPSLERAQSVDQIILNAKRLSQDKMYMEREKENLSPRTSNYMAGARHTDDHSWLDKHRNFISRHDTTLLSNRLRTAPFK